MSNLTDFTGLQNRQFCNSLKPFISSHLPVMNEALRRNIGTWWVDGSRFAFRYAPRGYSRLNTLLSFYNAEMKIRSYSEITNLLAEQKEKEKRGEEVQPVQLAEIEAFAAMLHEVQALRDQLIGRTDSLSSRSVSWGDDFEEEQQEQAEPPAEGLSVFIQDWWTTTHKGKKRSHEGIEIILQAHEADDEASEEAEGAPVWGT